MHVEVRVQEADFELGAEYAAQRVRLEGRAGAVASFVGLVRDRAGDASVAVLHLEHYPGMTEKSIEAIVRQAGERWPLDDVVVIHRVGALAPSAQIVLVLVASAHRAAAFAGCEYIMDYLKTDAVFWKREDTDAGSRWVESTAEDAHRVSGWRDGGPAGS